MLDFLFTFYHVTRHTDMWQLWDMKLSSDFPVPELRGKYFDFGTLNLHTGVLEIWKGVQFPDTKVLEFNTFLTTEG